MRLNELNDLMRNKLPILGTCKYKGLLTCLNESGEMITYAAEIEGKIILTYGIAALGSDKVNKIFELVRLYGSNGEFDDEDNNPYGENDFGSIRIDDETVYFKFDYYNKDLESWGHDVHTLTIMLAEEY